LEKHPQALLVRGVRVKEATQVARWSFKHRTLSIAVAQLNDDTSEEDEHLQVCEQVCQVTITLPPTTASVASTLQSTFDSIAKFDRCASRFNALATNLHTKAIAMVSQRPKNPTREGNACCSTGSEHHVEPIVEGLQLLEQPNLMYGAPAISTGQLWWPAAVAMVRTLRAHPNLLPAHVPFKALEIGSGMGLVGMFVAKTWPQASVLLSDVETALPLLSKNVAANFAQDAGTLDRISVQALPWGPVGETECASLVVTLDVVLGSDVCYRRDLTELVLWTLCRLRAPCTLISLGDREGSRDHFVSACALHGIILGAQWHFSGSEVERPNLIMAQSGVYMYELILPGSTSSDALD